MGYRKFIFNYFFYVFISFLMFVSVESLAQTNVSTLKKRRNQNEKDIAYTNTLLKKTLKNKNISLAQLKLLNQRIKVRKALVQSIENEVSYIGNQIRQITAEITTLKEELDKLKKQYERIVLYAYKQKSSYEKLMFLLSSKDFNQAYKRYKYLQQFSEYTRKQGKEISIKKEALDAKLIHLNKIKKEKQNLLAQKSEENSKLSQEKKQQSVLVDQLKKRERQLRDDLRKQKQYARKLEKEIQRIIQKQAQLASKNKSGTGKYGLTPEEKVLSASFGNNKGKLPWPTKTGFISEKFGEHPHPVLRHVKVRNDGINITTDANSDCRAVFKGEVTHILSMPGLNNVVIIRHGEFFSVYSNLSVVTVKKGDLVGSKEKIGVVYTDQTKAQTVLKFQLWKESTKLDPAVWLYPN